MNMDGQDEQDFGVRRQSEAATALSQFDGSRFVGLVVNGR
jgi:hypothetical protein|tara:strand:- start:1721 stop:1840 length:120 start_codon:yes stop_codon:yes gene_type:complete